MLKQILLNNEDPYNNVEDDDDEFSRARVSSMSGRPVRQKGMAILIGDESSSESEGEEDANRRSSGEHVCISRFLCSGCSHKRVC